MHEPPSRADSSHRRRILVIDDDIGMTTLCRRVLEQTGDFAVREVNDGLRAIETARDFRPHLIFLDRMMPGKDGAQIAAELSVEASLQSVPIVFLTGQVDCGASIGGHPVLLKPIRGVDLIRTSSEMALRD